MLAAFLAAWAWVWAKTMTKLLTRRLPNSLLSMASLLLVAWLFFWPRPWAAELARKEIEDCYTNRVMGNEEGCAFGIKDFRDANDAYGALRSYRVVSVSRGIMNTSYTVVVDAERERSRTREVASVHADNGRDHTVHATLMDLTVTPRP